MENRIISVITPLYKGKKYIPNLLLQVKENLHELRNYNNTINVELIMVNDYPSEQIDRNEYLSEGINIIIKNNSVNSGIHYSRVEGLKISNGDMILFLDQDDCIDNNFLVKTYREYISNKSDVIVTNAWMEKANHEKGMLYSRRGQERNLFDIKTYLYAHNQIASPGQCLIRKSSIPKEWLDNILYVNGSDDLLLWILMLSKEASFRFINECLYTHKYTGSNLSASAIKMSKSTLELITVLHSIEYIDKKNVEILKQSRSMNLQLHDSSGVEKLIIIIKYMNVIFWRLFFKIRSKL